MIRTLRRRRRCFASLVLGLCLFALGVSVAHACGFDGAGGHVPRSAASDRQQLAEDAPLPSGDHTAYEWCCPELSFAAKTQPLPDPPGAPPFVLIAFVDVSLTSSETPVSGRPTPAHRAIDVPLSIRYVRLTL